MKPLVTQCAAVADPKNTITTRCKNRPDKNGYFCIQHWNELHHSEINAVIIRGMPYVIGRNWEAVRVRAPEVSKKKKKKKIVIKGNIQHTVTESGSTIIEPKSSKKLDSSEKEKSYINNKEFKNKLKERMKDFKGIKGSDIVEIAKEMGIKGKFTKRKELIKAILIKEMEAA